MVMPLCPMAGVGRDLLVSRGREMAGLTNRDSDELYCGFVSISSMVLTLSKYSFQERSLMQAFAKSIDADSVDWHHIQGEPGDTYNLDYEYSLLGYDKAAGKLDMLMRFRPGGGYCEPHSHMAATTIMILQGEQHVEEQLADGGVKKIVRRAGEYAITGRDALPHLETGGPEGAVILLSLQTNSGILFEAFNPQFNKLRVLNTKTLCASS
jgi:hypothetical protein